MTQETLHVGLTSEPRTFEVEKGALKFFALATGETNPIYSDEAAAKAAGHRSIPAPPTYAVVMQSGTPSKRNNILDHVDIGRILHGEQQFVHHKPIYAGDVITLVTTTTDIYEKKGGALKFIVQDTTCTNQDGELCVVARNTIVERQG